jgi:hypothetical protein
MAHTHLEIGGTIGGPPVALCGTKTRTNPLEFFRGFDPTSANWGTGTFNGPTCGRCYAKAGASYFAAKKRKESRAIAIAINRCRLRPRHQSGLCTCGKERI